MCNTTQYNSVNNNYNMCNGYGWDGWPRSECKNHKTDIIKPKGKASSVLKLHIYFVIDKTVNVFCF